MKFQPYKLARVGLITLEKPQVIVNDFLALVREDASQLLTAVDKMQLYAVEDVTGEEFDRKHALPSGAILTSGNQESAPIYIVVTDPSFIVTDQWPQIVIDLQKLAYELDIQLVQSLGISRIQHGKQAVIDDLLDNFFLQVHDKWRVLVLDEAQRHIRLIEKLVKTNNSHRVSLLITGTPAQGKNAIDFGGSAECRCASVHIEAFHPYEVFAFMKRAFNQQRISSRLLVDLWTVFCGEPSAYQMLFQMAKADKSLQESLLTDGIGNQQVLATLTNNGKVNYESLDKPVVDAQLRRGVLHSKMRRRPASGAIMQLLARHIVEPINTLSDFLDEVDIPPTHIVWRDSLAVINSRSSPPTG